MKNHGPFGHLIPHKPLYKFRWYISLLRCATIYVNYHSDLKSGILAICQSKYFLPFYYQHVFHFFFTDTFVDSTIDFQFPNRIWSLSTWQRMEYGSHLRTQLLISSTKLFANGWAAVLFLTKADFRASSSLKSERIPMLFKTLINHQSLTLLAGLNETNAS